MGWIRVCENIKGTLKDGTEQYGFGIDGYKKSNFDGIPGFLKKGYDCIGIVSGMSKVRIGKCLKKGSKVLMSNGEFKLVEDIIIDDEVISPQEDGSFTYETVTETHNRFEDDCYDIIEESTGRLLYSCANNHIIPLFKNNLKNCNYEYKLIEASELSKSSIKNKNQFYCLTSPKIEFKNIEPEIEPYCLGVWLGDGHFSSKRKLNKEYIGNRRNKHNGYWLAREIGITTNDKVIIDYVSKFYPISSIANKKGTTAKTYRFNMGGEFSKQLTILGLESKNSETKFIPKVCLTSSIQFRIKLLAGLIDTDGYINKNNSASITTKSYLLANDIKSLVHSLGGMANIKKISKGIKSIGFIGDYFNVCISFSNPTIIPLLVKRKLDRLHQSRFNRNHIYIKCIKSSPGEVYGFAITGKSKLYITDNWMITHNSTCAMQDATYLVWRLAGGVCKCHQETIDGKQKWIVDKVIQPKREIHWDVYENVAFSAEELQEKAMKLYNKYGKNQVLVYDEGRQGLDSARAMESINKGMEDFFQTCGFMGHIIIIVLPSFFKLHEDYAVARSLYLINVYADKHYNRGYFSFYNEDQKEKLFYFGKKRIGVRAKYTSASYNFWGKFSSWFPFDRKAYDKLKEEAIKKIRKSKQQQKFKRQRDSAIYLLRKYTEMSSIDIANELSIVSGKKISERMVRYAISGITKQNEDEVG